MAGLHLSKVLGAHSEKEKKKKINPGAHRDVTTTALPHLDSPVDCGKCSQHILD